MARTLGALPVAPETRAQCHPGPKAKDLDCAKAEIPRSARDDRCGVQGTCASAAGTMHTLIPTVTFRGRWRTESHVTLRRMYAVTCGTRTTARNPRQSNQSCRDRVSLRYAG